MIIVRFYTELPNIYEPNHLVAWESRLGWEFGGFTRYDATGYWQGKAENSRVYETVFSEVGDWRRIVRVLKFELADILHQTEVLVIWHYGDLL